MNKRINFLDGFRGLAVLLTVFYHAYSRHSAIVPYGDKYASLIPFQQGFLGVQLFFLISGFVILMSLEKSNNFSQFIYKRWVRLFPAMLIATIIIYYTAVFLPERPEGIPHYQNVISGLIFINPAVIEKITGINIGILEGTFWTLFVEVKFYIIFGILYFWLGTRKAILSISTMFFTWFLIINLKLNFISLNKLFTGLSISDVQFFGWFASGALAYLYHKNRSKMDLMYSIIIGTMSTLVYRGDIANLGFIFILLTIFISAVYFDKFKDVFDNKFLVFFGFISYPLYLIHESIMIALVIKLGANFRFIPQVLLPVIPIGFLSVISYLIAKSIEPYTRKLIDKNVSKLLLVKKTEAIVCIGEGNLECVTTSDNSSLVDGALILKKNMVDNSITAVVDTEEVAMVNKD